MDDVIEMIPVEQLMHHPYNPRKDLGDLTELAASIKANGIFQNLTVVRPDNWRADDGDYYWVLIGNRRMEAALRAGILELPCQVVHMSHKEQIATMLQENMQRSDLTVYEQAKGIQTMMDLGFDQDQICERTGFSRSTVERRLAVASLPEKEAKQAVGYGYDLTDLIEISKLESREKQKELLTDSSRMIEEGKVDRNWLRQRIVTAKRDEERQREKDRLRPCVEMFAKEMTQQQATQIYGSGWEHLHKYDVDLKPDAVVKRPKEDGPFYYHITFGSIEIWRRAKREKHVKTEGEIALELKKQKARELNDRMRENRISYVAGWVPTKMQEAKLKAALWDYVFNNVSPYNNGDFEITYHGWNSALFRMYCGMPREEERDKHETIMAEIERRGIPLGRAILAWILCGGVRADDREGYASQYNGTYKKEEQDLDRVYQVLMDNGYLPDEEEMQWKNGTHPLYSQEVPREAQEPEEEEE